VDERIAALNDWLIARNGVVTRSRLMRIGFSRGSVVALTRSGHLAPIWRGAYRSGAVPVGRLQIMSAICQQHPAAAIAFTTAGREWGFRHMTDPRVHVLVPHAMTPTVPEVVVHRCRRIDPVDVALERPDGIRLTSPPRTLFDCAAILDDDQTASVIEQAMAERRCTMDTLFSTMVRLRHSRRPGSRRFETVLESRPALRGAARSMLERRVRAAIQHAGLPKPRVNHVVRLPSGHVYEIDLCWPDHTLAVEVDHPFWHDREAESARDKLRDRKLSVAGWSAQRLSQEDVESRLADAVGDLRALLIDRGWVPSAA
jgi:very-short-patch-repair endonuclease